MKRLTINLFAGLALLTGVALAADVTGKWTGEAGGPGGPGGMSITFNFKQDGMKLTGTADGPGGETQINDGKVEGDKMSFTITVGDGGEEIKIAHEGTIKEDEIVLSMKMKGGPGGGPPGRSITLKRAR